MATSSAVTGQTAPSSAPQPASTAATSTQKQQPPPSSNPQMEAARAQAMQASRPTNSPASAQAGTSFPRPQPQRPPLNTQQPNASSVPSASQPVPLSHSAALDAARSHSEQQRTTSGPASATVQSAQMHSASTNRPESSNRQAQYTISKQLPQTVMDRPFPVQGPAQRPSLAAQGVMSAPVIPKTNAFVLEGEGSSRVLSKKKLDELVRQVTGGTDALSPEVEEVRNATCTV